MSNIDAPSMHQHQNDMQREMTAGMEGCNGPHCQLTVRCGRKWVHVLIEFANFADNWVVKLFSDVAIFYSLEEDKNALHAHSLYIGVTVLSNCCLNLCSRGKSASSDKVTRSLSSISASQESCKPSRMQHKQLITSSGNKMSTERYMPQKYSKT